MSKSSSDREMRNFSMHDGDVHAWVEQEAIHVKVIFRSSRDPVELTGGEARKFAAALISMADDMDQYD